MTIAEPLLVFQITGLLLNALLEISLGVGGVMILLFLSGLVSGSEVAFFSLTPNDYEELEGNDSSSARELLQLRNMPRMLLATILIANNLINIAIVLLSDFIIRRAFPNEVFITWATNIRDTLPFLQFISEDGMAQGISFLITVLAATFLLVLFGEVAPKVYARYNRLKLALQMARPLKFLLWCFRPLAFLLVRGAGVVERRLENHSQDGITASQEEIDEAIELTVSSEDHGEEGPQDVGILKRIVQFSNVTVRQIMRSRGDVIAVDQKIGYPELLTVIRESSYSRIPVFEEDFDQVKGLLYVKDLLGHRHEPPDFEWQKLVRTEVLYVPGNKKINDLLREFQQEKMHMAIVVDEYGGTEGVVTLEDILEEVIGDIQDEFDEGDDIIYQRIDNLNYIFDGKTLLGDVCRVLDLPTNTFDDVKGEAESLAGLLLEMLGQFPQPEEEIECGEYRFKVMAMTNRRVEEILVTLPEPAPENG
ncbi:gliding motility-associated protein GldE [Lewinella sp. W8]|uniref:gliding motility-associated protein GldE n=1 Tax=Lewinella sp. W8 TaxID=2528208 RepID=UPI0020A63199|nr:gliding motility-associated protein GldE [Lewinella sp. W8]